MAHKRTQLPCSLYTEQFSQILIKIIKNYLNLCSLSCWTFLCVLWACAGEEMNNQEKMRDVRCEMRPGRGSSLQRCTACTACIRLHISRCTVVYDALQCIHIPRFFLCFKMRKRFFIPDTVLVQFCLPSTPTHGCIIVAVTTNCTSVIPSTSFTLVTSVTLAILVTSVILVNLVTHHLATLRTLPHSLPHPKLPLPYFYHPLTPLPTLLHLPLIILKIDPVWYILILQLISNLIAKMHKRAGHEGALVEKRIIQPI